jgi:hypothetical protein
MKECTCRPFVVGEAATDELIAERVYLRAVLAGVEEDGSGILIDVKAIEARAYEITAEIKRRVKAELERQLKAASLAAGFYATRSEKKAAAEAAMQELTVKIAAL